MNELRQVYFLTSLVLATYPSFEGKRECQFPYLPNPNARLRVAKCNPETTSANFRPNVEIIAFSQWNRDKMWRESKVTCKIPIFSLWSAQMRLFFIRGAQLFDEQVRLFYSLGRRKLDWLRKCAVRCGFRFLIGRSTGKNFFHACSIPCIDQHFMQCVNARNVLEARPYIVDRVCLQNWLLPIAKKIVARDRISILPFFQSIFFFLSVEFPPWNDDPLEFRELKLCPNKRDTWAIDSGMNDSFHDPRLFREHILY